MPQLTLVDLSGLIQTETRGVTKADVNLVADITDHYVCECSPASISVKFSRFGAGGSSGQEEHCSELEAFPDADADPDFDRDHDHDHHYLHHLVYSIVLLGKPCITGRMAFVRRPQGPDYPALLRRPGIGVSDRGNDLLDYATKVEI